MTLKEELEILRGEPILVFDGDPMDIPCIETSDAEKLCKHPVVSVHMITYNHEPYIRQAIEGVMMQKTDFEFELVIGEDCSQDKTREICFEYQKKYPDKIRVLWWHENVSKFGGNGRRVTAHCRGEFIAYCEGDDYWIDPLKLQKQVDYIRETDSVMCVANSEWHNPDGSVRQDVYKKAKGLLELDDFLAHYFHTTTYLLNRHVYEECRSAYSELIFWYDAVTASCMATMGKTCVIPDIVSVYNWTGLGMGGADGSQKRDMLLMSQFAQFAFCHNSKISDYYTERFISKARSCMQSFSFSGFRHTLAKRIRVARVVWDICWMKRRRMQGSIFLIKFPVWTLISWIKIHYMRHPRIGIFWRRVKRICG